MSVAPVKLPPLPEIREALERTTEHLARELQAPSAAAPCWSEIDWNIARAVAALHGTSALLAGALRWRGPPPWQEFLAEQLRQSGLRDLLIGGLLTRIDAALRGRGIPAVALKGAALRALAVYPPGCRPMGDVDLLIRPAHLDAVSDALGTIGYRHAFSMARHAVFEPVHATSGPVLGEHESNPLKIEVHTRVAEPLPMDAVDITDGLFPRTLQPGCNPYRDESALFAHLLLHAAGNMRAHALRQVQLEDIARMARRLGADAWRALAAGRAVWMLPPLALTANYYPGSIPEAPLDTLRRAAPRRLARYAARATLTRVSWSNLRIHAFPGIAWAASAGEALRFAASRVVPRNADLEMLAHAVAAQPALRSVSWYELSHGRRILRWLFARTARVQTMVSVRAALGAPEPPS